MLFATLTAIRKTTSIALLLAAISCTSNVNTSGSDKSHPEAPPCGVGGVEGVGEVSISSIPYDPINLWPKNPVSPMFISQLYPKFLAQSGYPEFCFFDVP